MIDIPVRVKDALKSGMYKKNYRVIVLDQDGNEIETLDNNRLVSESVKLDERMCSGKTLTFGLCEGSSLEFQYFDYENINGKRVKLMLDVEYLDEEGGLSWYEIPMGYYDVDSCPMQFSTGIRKATCYNKLKSEYLDRKANDLILGITNKDDIVNNKLTYQGVVSNLLKDFSIPEKGTEFIEPIKTSETVKIPNNSFGWYGYHDTNIYKTLDDDIPHPLYVDYEVSVTTLKYIIPPNKRVYITPTYGKIIKERLLDWVKRALSSAPAIVREIPESHREWGIFSDVWAVSGYQAREEAPSNMLNLFKDFATVKCGNVEKVYSLLDDDENSSSDLMTFVPSPNGYEIDIRIPVYIDVYGHKKQYPSQTTVTISRRFTLGSSNYQMYVTTRDPNAGDLVVDAKTLPDVTLREMQGSLFEMQCRFGQIDRSLDLFSGVKLNNDRLFPSDSLYPANNLYPKSNAERTDASAYEKLWTDSVGVQRFRYLIITYKGKVGGEEKELTLQRTVNTDGTTDYNMSNNWMFKNLVWTEQQVAGYADAMVELMRNVSWFPFEMWAAGLPYIETGDELEITNAEGTYTSYVLQRQLNGIQMLKDTFINGELDIF